MSRIILIGIVPLAVEEALRRRRVPRPPQAHALEALLTFYKKVMHGNNALPYVEREMIAETVSVLNQCHY